MARLPGISGRDAVQVVEWYGWRMVWQRGSHMIMTKPGETAVLSVPNHRELKRGTLRGLIRNAGLDVETFMTLLR